MATLVFLPGERHGQKNLTDDSSWGPKESDMTEGLMHTPPEFPSRRISCFLLNGHFYGQIVTLVNRGTLIFPSLYSQHLA